MKIIKVIISGVGNSSSTFPGLIGGGSKLLKTTLNSLNSLKPCFVTKFHAGHIL